MRASQNSSLAQDDYEMDYKLVQGNLFTPSQIQAREQMGNVVSVGYDAGTSPMTCAAPYSVTEDDNYELPIHDPAN